jgi:ADP-ribosylglycohydrolase
MAARSDRLPLHRPWPPVSLRLDRFRGCLLGGATGDALGAAVEFDSLDRIRQRFGPQGLTDPVEAYGRVGAITDDTQMTLFTAEAILQADDRLERGIGHPANQLWAAYQRWLKTQGEETVAGANETWVWHGELHRQRALFARRAPGNTCLSALRRPQPQDSLAEVIDNNSKGCGAVMRAAPCGLIGERYGSDGPFRLGVTPRPDSRTGTRPGTSRQER